MRGHGIMGRLWLTARAMRRTIYFVLACATTLITSPARAYLYEVATFSTTEDFYPDLTLLSSPPSGNFTDSNFNVPLVQYGTVTTSRLSEGWPISTTVLQSVDIQASNAPASGPATSLLPGLQPYDPISYSAYTYIGLDAPGTVLYSKAPPPPTASSLYISVAPGGPNSISGKPTSISASAIVSIAPPSNYESVITLPEGVQTLTGAAASLHYSSFQWEQTITIPAPSPYYECTNLNCKLAPPENVKGTTLDPPQYGYTYCNPTAVGYVKGDCSLNNPFYPSQLSNTSIGFYDQPIDTCLFGGPTQNSCNGHQALPPSVLGFTTSLVGIPENGGLPLIFSISTGSITIAGPMDRGEE